MMPVKGYMHAKGLVNGKKKVNPYQYVNQWEFWVSTLRLSLASTQVITEDY
jgi:hypothetical protein